MDASERLIRVSKSGNIKEVKKLLSRGALFTKDKVGKHLPATSKKVLQKVFVLVTNQEFILFCVQ